MSDFASGEVLARAPFATPINAKPLIGDLYGDADEYGDLDDIGFEEEAGDLDYLTGDLDTLTGDAKRRKKKKRGGPVTRATASAKSALKKNRDGSSLGANGRGYRYLSLKNVDFVSGPFPEKAAGNVQSYMTALQRMTSENPALTEVIDSTYAPGTHSITTVALGSKLFVPIYIVAAAPQLLHRPNIRITITASIPTPSGPVAINNLILKTRQENQFIARFMPFQVVALEQFPALGSQDALNPITFSITGLDSGATADYRVSLVIPGVNDKLTKIMRARFAKFD